MWCGSQRLLEISRDPEALWLFKDVKEPLLHLSTVCVFKYEPVTLCVFVCVYGVFV